MIRIPQRAVLKNILRYETYTVRLYLDDAIRKPRLYREYSHSNGSVTTESVAFEGAVRSELSRRSQAHCSQVFGKDYSFRTGKREIKHGQPAPKTSR